MKRLNEDHQWSTDDYPVYASILPRAKHTIGKANTHLIESNNASQRARFARFHRKTHAFSRSLEMVHLTMVLFATYHVNGNFNRLISLVR
jgi:insertion element IS1 protein InsB